jgi:predicted PhzF superfamily epimerase YddE/YHI9
VPELHVLRVFVNEDREWGNALGVLVDGSSIAESERQPLATELGFSETVFVEDRAGRIRIHTPAVELPFAGHPTVGTAWLLAQLGTPVGALRPPAGDVSVRIADGRTWIGAHAKWSPPFEYRQLATPADVRQLDAADPRQDVYAWAWIDESAGTIRARSFAPGAGIVEDEATGSAALALSARLGRAITVHQGHGSVLLAHPMDDGWAEVGGAVVLDEVRSV